MGEMSENVFCDKHVMIDVLRQLEPYEADRVFFLQQSMLYLRHVLREHSVNKRLKLKLQELSSFFLQ